MYHDPFHVPRLARRDPLQAQEYRAYYVSQPANALNQILGRVLTLATSKDGATNWTRPMLPFVPFGNFSHTNILLETKGAAEISQVSVFLNRNRSGGNSNRTSSSSGRTPTGPASGATLPSSSYRYEMFFLSKDVPPAFTADPARFPPSVTAPCAATKTITAAYSGVECMYRMVSDDGFKWTPFEVVVRPCYTC